MLSTQHKHKVQRVNYLVEKTYFNTRKLGEIVGFGSTWIYQMNRKGRVLRPDQVEKVVEYFENLSADLRKGFNELKRK